MSLSPGTKLGAFEILGLLGVGGMGEVYRARDTKLDREVAIKVLPSDVAQDRSRLARFEREARLLASLNHPNIAHIYGLEEAEGESFLVMELVEGPTLADRLVRGPMPVAEALSLFAQLAEGLEAAHESGVIHRDLKPANIKVTERGKIKVLDFGLAKAFEPASSPDDGGTLALSEDAVGKTSEGQILGTPAYMSPEQARGQNVDKRTDIWAFGCCLYEALMGQRPFRGDSAAELFASIIDREPDWESLPQDIPGRVRVVLWRCLQKDPHRRLRDIGEAVFELGGSLSDPSELFPGGGSTAPPPDVRPRTVAFTSLATLLLGAFLAAMFVRPPEVAERISADTQPQRTETRPIQSHILFERDLPVSDQGYFALSPNGRYLAYLAEVPEGTTLHIRDLETLETTRIEVEGMPQDPFFSHDSQWVGFDVIGRLMKVSVLGKSPIRVGASEVVAKGTWLTENTIAFASLIDPGWKLMTISAEGGEEKELITLPGGVRMMRPNALPNGRGILLGYKDSKSPRGHPELVLFRVDTGELQGLSIQGYFPRYADSGHLLYIQKDTLWAVPFDLDHLAIVGAPQPLNIEINCSPASGRGGYDVSETGLLVYAPKSSGRVVDDLVRLDRSGSIEPLTSVDGYVTTPRLSPDETRLAFGGGSMSAISPYVYNLEGDLDPIPLIQGMTTLESIWERPEGKRIVIGSAAGTWGVFILNADLTSKEPQALYRSGSRISIPWDTTPQGDEIIFTQFEEEKGMDIWAVSADNPNSFRELVNTAFDEDEPRVSPDGKWLAYASNRSGRYEIWTRRFPASHTAAPQRVSNGGGREPVFSAASGELFYIQGRTIFSVKVPTDLEPDWGIPEPVIEIPFRHRRLQWRGSYDVSRDGQTFYLSRPRSDPDSRRNELVLVQNYFQELERIAPREEASKN